MFDVIDSLESSGGGEVLRTAILRFFGVVLAFSACDLPPFF